MSESIEKTIDIDKILKSKMGSKVKFVPRFLVSWLDYSRGRGEQVLVGEPWPFRY